MEPHRSPGTGYARRPCFEPPRSPRLPRTPAILTPEFLARNEAIGPLDVVPLVDVHLGATLMAKRDDLKLDVALGRVDIRPQHGKAT